MVRGGSGANGDCVAPGRTFWYVVLVKILLAVCMLLGMVV